jgi:hypothetical protein
MAKNRDYKMSTLQSLLDSGDLTPRDFAVFAKGERFEITAEKKPIYVVLQPTIADKLPPYSLSLYYWLKSVAGYEYLDFSIQQMCNMTGIKSDKKLRACLFVLYFVGVIKVEKSYKEVHIITLCDEETARKKDADMSYRDRRGIYWSHNAPKKIDDRVPRSKKEQIHNIHRKQKENVQVA